MNSCDCLTFLNKSTSYAEFPTWNAIRKGTLQFKFKTYNRYGLLLYIDDSSTEGRSSNFLQLSLNYGGRLEVIIQMGEANSKSYRRRIIGSNLNNLEWHYVRLKRNGSQTVVSIDHWTAILITQGRFDYLPVNSNLYIGGVPSRLRKQVVNRGVFYVQR